MAKVLVLETDPVSAALIEDRLHVGGHRALLTDDPVRLLSAASEGQADLVVLALELADFSGLGIVRQLREQGESRSLPIVALSRGTESADRIAALRAGADDYLTRPFDVEELMLRIDRLLGSRGEASPVMKGDLASHPAWELVQFIQQAGKSGELAIHGARGSGQLRVRGGRVVSARWQKLRGRDALLAILDAQEGQFRLTTDTAAEQDADGAAEFAIQEVLIEAAWLEDELARRRQHLPATGARLRRQTDELPPIDDDELRRLPIAKIFGQLGEQPGARLFDLVHQADDAPSKVRLAVTWLVEQGAVAPEAEDGAGEIMNTVELSSSMVLDLAIHGLLSAAHDAGFKSSPLSYLLLVEAGVWPRMVELLENEPGCRNHPTLGQLAEQLRRGQGGRADFVTDYGTISLHAEALTEVRRPRIETLLSQCAGVFLWLDQAAELELARSLVERLEAAGDGPPGVLVAGTGTAAELTARTRRWRVAHHAPRSLIGVLRLLHPASAS